MATNPDNIVSRITELCKQLISFAQASEAGTSAYEAESVILHRVLQMGNLAVQAFLEAQAKHYHHSTTEDAQGRTLPYSGERGGVYYSIFGAIQFARSYYCGGGNGSFPTDAGVNLPLKGQSDLLRKMAEELAVSMSYEDATMFLASYFPVSTSTRGVQAIIETDCQDAEAYYDQAPPPPENSGATILCVQADNKGVPMVKPSAGGAQSDPMPGQQKGERTHDGKTKEATVVSVSTHIPFIRTPEQVRDSLFKKRDEDIKIYEAPKDKPVSKRTWATMGGKEKGLQQAYVWAQQSQTVSVAHKLTLLDGCEGLKNRVSTRFPDYIRILDLIHAIQYLWKAADAQFGKKSQQGWEWTYTAVLRMLRGQTQSIIDELDGWVEDSTEPAAWTVIQRSAGYFEKNLEAMKYDEYLEKGWPIASGIIEGACRSVVKDRCERSGMRWTLQGVEAFLQLRCVHQNGDWEAYHDFRMQKRQENVYGVRSERRIQIDEPDLYRSGTNRNLAIAV